MGVIEDRSIFDDHEVKKLEIGKRVAEIAQCAPCVEDQLAPGCAEPGKRGKSMWIDSAIGGDGFVVVSGERLYVLQSSSQSRSRSMRTSGMVCGETVPVCAVSTSVSPW